ncbi:MAG TPA: carbamoyl-phosphate synthase small subunit [Planctomycetes bacterium]|nr:carbamoyl-phosphate synthase small subunit [Planctomycetota bacterium]
MRRDPSRLWRARLILEDGSVFRGTSFGAEGESGGEVVFNTAMSGYQEVLTDPSYTGQIVCMTAPLVGNYGVTGEDMERDRPSVAGFLVREASTMASNYRAREDLRGWLSRFGVIALEGMDTRAITRRVRDKGAMRGFVTTEPLEDDVLQRRLRDVEELVGRDLVSPVSRTSEEEWTEPVASTWLPDYPKKTTDARMRVVAFDFGAKDSILRCLRSLGCDVIVVPSGATAEEVLAHAPDGVFLSNGPGDPRPLEGPTAVVRELLGCVPMFGICLGHQIMAQAVGAEIVKLKFGHHGSNHPVKDLTTGKVEITAQNHGFAVTRESLEECSVRVTHLNLNDGTVEGMELPDRQAFSVQYHPEASPGPHDALYLFERFRDLMVEARAS